MSPVHPPEPEVDPEEEVLRMHEEALHRKREEHATQLRKLEEEEDRETWYGPVVRNGKSSFFPKTYVQAVEIGDY